MTKPTGSMFDLDVTKMMSEFKVPALDIESLMNSQRKNIEALTRANQLALEGFQTLARRQAELMRGGFENASSVMREVMQTQSPEDRMGKHAEIAQRGLESALANARELAEIFTKAQSEAFEVLNRRVTESLEEVKTLVKR